MRSLTVVVLLLVSSHAFAQDAPPTDPKMTIGASATIWIPQSDADDTSDVSFGVRPHFSYRVLPFLAIVSSFDFVFVNEEDGVDDVTYYTIAAGARIMKMRPGSVSPYGEFLLGWHKIDTEGLDESDIGFRLGGGVLYGLGDNLLLNASLGYSAVSMDAGFVDFDVEAFILEVGVGWQL
jgi:hypothetical protein